MSPSLAKCRKWTEFPGARQDKAFQTTRRKSVSLSCCRMRENQLMYRCQLSPWRTPSLDMTHAGRDMTLPHDTARPSTVIGASGYGTGLAEPANDATANQPAHNLLTTKPFSHPRGCRRLVERHHVIHRNRGSGWPEFEHRVCQAGHDRAVCHEASRAQACCCEEAAETRPCRDAGDRRMQFLQCRNYLAPAACRR
jgi:hypothetical protein